MLLFWSLHHGTGQKVLVSSVQLLDQHQSGGWRPTIQCSLAHPRSPDGRIPGFFAALSSVSCPPPFLLPLYIAPPLKSEIVWLITRWCWVQKQDVVDRSQRNRLIICSKRPKDVVVGFYSLFPLPLESFRGMGDRRVPAKLTSILDQEPPCRMPSLPWRAASGTDRSILTGFSFQNKSICDQTFSPIIHRIYSLVW